MSQKLDLVLGNYTRNWQTVHFRRKVGLNSDGEGVRLTLQMEEGKGARLNYLGSAKFR